MENKLVGHGFIAPTITPDNHIFGGQQIPKIIQENGLWHNFIPPFEQQARTYFDTYGCTVYNTLTPIEILERRLFGEDSEYAERFVYIGTGTRPPGNDPHMISEWIRHNGLIPEAMLPFTDMLQGLNDYASPNPLTVNFTEQGKKWLLSKTYTHDWVMGGNAKEKTIAAKQALKSSPLGVSVVAWQERDGMYYKDEGQQDNHWTCLIGYDGDSPIILDSYAPFLKRLAPYYNFSYIKRYSITKNVITKKTFYQMCSSYWNEIMK